MLCPMALQPPTQFGDPDRLVSAWNDSTLLLFGCVAALKIVSSQSTKKVTATAIAINTTTTTKRTNRFTMFRTAWIIYSILVFRFSSMPSKRAHYYFFSSFFRLVYSDGGQSYDIADRKKNTEENKSFIFQFNQWLKQTASTDEQQQWNRPKYIKHTVRVRAPRFT